MAPLTALVVALVASASAQLIRNPPSVADFAISSSGSNEYHEQQLPISSHQTSRHPTPFKTGQYTLKQQDNSSCPTYGESQWTGTVDVTDTQRLFFWFFESRSDPSNDPVIIWMNGGPGGSSMVGLFHELGPCIFNMNSSEPAPNPWAWNNNASVLFLDQPAGVGFASLADEAPMPAADLDGAPGFQSFLNIFFGKMFPERANLPIHVAAESYGGHYGPVYLKHILDSRAYDSRSAFWGNITSLILVDALLDWTGNAVGTYELLCSDHFGGGGIINSTACDKIRHAMPEAERLGLLCDLSQDGHECVGLDMHYTNHIDVYYRELIESGRRSPFNIHQDCPSRPLCYTGKGNFTRYLNQGHVKSALGFPESFVYNGINLDMNTAYTLGHDPLKTTTRELGAVLDAHETGGGLGDIRVLVLNGNDDYIVNTPGQQYVYDNLRWSGQADYRISSWRALPEELAASGFWKGTDDGRLVRKVACDHTQPVCNRCRATNRERECTYTISSSRPVRHWGTAAAGRDVPAPPPPPPRHSVTLSSPTTATSADARPTAVLSPLLQDRNFQNGSSPDIVTPSGSSEDQPSGPPSAPPAPGFFGILNHSAVYEETKNTLSLLQGFQACLPGHGDAAPEQYRDPSQVLSSPMREMCLVVLRSIPTPSEGRILMRISPHPYDGWARVAAQRVLSSLYERFGTHLGPSRTNAQLEEMALFLSRNSARPLNDDEPDPDRWIGQFSGPNLRWESLGLLYTFRELGDETPREQDPCSDIEQFTCGLTRHWPEIARVCLGLCIDLTRRFSDGNSLLLQLCIRRTVAESILSGDASASCWRCLAESVSLMTFLGLHDESETPDYRPTLSSETRRRIAAHVFIMDKVIVLFTGRPPLIGHRYASTPLPLDIQDQHLIAGDEAISRALESLDERGWNTDGGLYASTSLRARLMIALIRDELIEIALGKWRQTRFDKLQAIKERQIQTMAEFPASLIYQHGELDSRSSSPGRVYAKLLIQLEHLQNLFVADRLLLRRGGGLDQSDLLLTSFEMVSLTLLFWTNKDRFALARPDFAWLVMAYATPAGGILCMELLNPSFTGAHPRNTKVTRSSIIQNLSLLIGFLDWIGPSAANGSLCANCSAVIQHVLDHTLNTTGSSSWPPEALDAMQLDFNFELFDTFEWLRTDVSTE
ncbi:N-terminal binuclear Zn cluster-containing/DNA binding domain-containing protein [Purpureocillium lavendulum]|uniref:Carboxypeptidase n=1 Tax=Purpureocillium lavendulum TaxID=1247861 RepID=A0AB34FPQ1_9HYPO|nr:N-terminal binuclear Zn cluster-containing/DNA binding domain-containing protein [Purpureocillium lavendulum]